MKDYADLVPLPLGKASEARGRDDRNPFGHLSSRGIANILRDERCGFLRDYRDLSGGEGKGRSMNILWIVIIPAVKMQHVTAHLINNNF
ncbi:hypothetical protein [Candidatus Methanocrinis natronophilus]|uniref:Uncharacterized protein n=1 Tax=Candidatus Methanocrinis natronophilus TaxID=3033396 RepID=A0ABT5X6T0_9EURY|nr:hypothetical protein [Candidatus Methanocrinis natronophilus]MDF0590392.1 hypothetical protein [Candidatus Methanocrinis natronophilus]